ncbi:TPA: hypothetical protein HA318_01790 [Candidatus Micrarchaeota archaeon]|nr:hypothetical protein [Candidatus Micrarchaeota archaeon]
MDLKSMALVEVVLRRHAERDGAGLSLSGEHKSRELGARRGRQLSEEGGAQVFFNASEVSRAGRTAELIAEGMGGKGVEVVSSSALVGRKKTKPVPEGKEKAALFKWIRYGVGAKETPEVIGGRVLSKIRELADEHRRSEGRAVVEVATHEPTILAFAKVLGFEYDAIKKGVRSLDGLKLRFHEGGGVTALIGRRSKDVSRFFK